MNRRSFIANLFAAPAALAVADERHARPAPKVIKQEIVIDVTDPDVDRLMAAFIDIDRYRSMVCACGAHPEPNESAWGGCFVEDDEVKFLCGSCWLELNAEDGAA